MPVRVSIKNDGERNSSISVQVQTTSGKPVSSIDDVTLKGGEGADRTLASDQQIVIKELK